MSKNPIIGVAALVLASVIAAAVFLIGSAQASEKLSVVVSIRPVHSLVSSLMTGAGAPKLLFEQAASPHEASMRPSQSRSLARADLVVWIGPALETSLERFLDVSSPKRRALALSDVQGLLRLTARKSGVWSHRHDWHEAKRLAGDGIDPHIWLSPANAKIMAAAVVDALEAVDPANSKNYRDNLRKLLADLTRLEHRLKTILDPVSEKPFVLLHDSQQYFEQAFGLSAAGALTPTSGRRPGAKRLRELRQTITAEDIHCILGDPHGASRLAKTLAQDGDNVYIAALDPLGLDIPPGPAHYEAMMQANARVIAVCLKSG